MVGLDALYFRSLRRMSIVDDDNSNAGVVDPIFFYVWEYDQDVNRVFLLRLQNMQEVSLACAFFAMSFVQGPFERVVIQ